MLGPDQDTLTEVLKGLGKRVGKLAEGCESFILLMHADVPFLFSQHSEHYHVEPRMYAYMRASLVHAFEQLFGKEYMTKELNDAWHEVFQAFASEMVPNDANEDWHAALYASH